jgi:hypothetical protein
MTKIYSSLTELENDLGRLIPEWTIRLAKQFQKGRVHLNVPLSPK